MLIRCKKISKFEKNVFNIYNNLNKLKICLIYNKKKSIAFAFAKKFEIKTH